MTQAVKKAKDTASSAKDTATSTVSSVTNASPVGDSLRRLAQTVAVRAATSLTDKATAATGRLTDYGSGDGGPGLLSAVTGGKPGVGGKAMTGALKGAFGGVKDAVRDKISNAFGGGGGGDGKGNKIKLTNIVEDVDIGAPVDVVYDQWTQFADFPRFMKKVEHVEQVSDTELRWKAQVFWSHRGWDASIVDQVPGERVVWRSEAKKGHVDGAVTFHELAPDLTRVMVVLEYHPQGLFERTGNLWRAQGRRVRLELKHFRRQVMTDSVLHPDDIDGWRGEIRDGEVVDDGQDAEDQDHETTDEDAEDQADEGPAEDRSDHTDEDDNEEDSAHDDSRATGRRR